MKRQIRYNTAANILRVEYPVEWNPVDVTGLSLTILDRDATELLTATAVTLYTDTALDGAVDKYSSTIILAAGSDDLTVGDQILLRGIEGDEVCQVKAYDSTSLTVELEAILKHDYADGDLVYGLFGDITVSTTVVATFPVGTEMTLLWTPTGDGIPTRELAIIAASALDVVGLRKRFQLKYSRAYAALTEPVDRIEFILNEAELEVNQELKANLIDIQRLPDQDGVSLAIMTKAVCIWLSDGDDDKIEERRVFNEMYTAHMGFLTRENLWTDDDQDNIEDEPEVTTHETSFGRAW